ncbi:ABC transporter permease [Aeromonas jandaei]|uniref:ABC transporter permease n=1 Tax=Aeromonas jandaei TaxID=650 RepID=A0A7T4A847_AERJA|nr:MULTISPECIES: ABC transporter permease [Aeromonas]BBQ54250.1 ABC transporter permease [Aeromonas veronii]MBL0609318.1 ABC transporter permease [Aeromonas jandaei]MBL0625342.1 ABC transporter permease [Aeromonas jandaei]MBM0489993.1 ABC transporter permease [Aeromonas jandaei]MBM0567490.1 ABC transporter permease subunit [Aeromonas jandaei]
MNSASLTMPTVLPRAPLRRRLSNLLYGRSGLLLGILLGPPLIWLGLIYAGSLLMLLSNSFFGLDEFSGQIRHEFTWQNFIDLARPENRDVILRTVVMSLLVTLACALIAFPIAYYMARYTRGRQRAFFYIAIMLPLWSSYLVRVYAWKLILAKEGAVNWLAGQLGLDGVLQALLSLPEIGGPSLSFSRIGTFIVFVYVWLPFMILPIQAAVERIPLSLIEASADLGATPGQTFRTLLLPLALPGVVAGSIFTFSLTLGDYIIPGIIGNSTLYIGQVVYMQQGTAGNLPFAAAFSLVPILIIAVYLMVAKRLGAFDAL